MKRVIALGHADDPAPGMCDALRAQGSDAGSAGPRLRFQTSSVAPQGDEAAVAQDVLEPGDIILTSAPRCGRSAFACSRYRR